jgi:hypothetical protein
MKDYIPTTDANFQNWAANFVAHATAHTIAIGLTAGDMHGSRHGLHRLGGRLPAKRRLAPAATNGGHRPKNVQEPVPNWVPVLSAAGACLPVCDF